MSRSDATGGGREGVDFPRRRRGGSLLDILLVVVLLVVADLEDLRVTVGDAEGGHALTAQGTPAWLLPAGA